MVEGGITLFAQWQKEAYNIVIKNDSETLITLENAEFGSVISFHNNYQDVISGLEIPTGKVYGGLYLESDTNYENKFLTDSLVADFGNDGDTVTLIVRWAAAEGTVSLNYNGATGGVTISELNKVYGDEMGELPVPTKDGYKFIGWYSVETNSESQAFDITKLTAGSIVTAQTAWEDNFTSINVLWAPVNEFTLTTNVNGGNWDGLDYHPTAHSINEQTLICGVSKNGYDFLGWETQSDMIINGIYMPAGTLLEENESKLSILPENSFVIGSS